MVAPLRYHPVLADVDEMVARLRPGQLLVVGMDVPDTLRSAGETRMVEDPEVTLPIGIYAFETDDQTELMVVTAGATPASPAEVDWTVGSHPLLSAHDWLGAWWTDTARVPNPNLNRTRARSEGRRSRSW